LPQRPATQNDVLIAGVAGLVAGAMSMAAGEYVSVRSQSDTEKADLARERKELSENAEFELDELAEIYVKRGVDQVLARQVARQLMAKDALTAHARDELGFSEITTARPVRAALTSAASFSGGCGHAPAHGCRFARRCGSSACLLLVRCPVLCTLRLIDARLVPVWRFALSSERRNGSALGCGSAPVTLAKPSHGSSKPIYRPRELRLAKYRLNRLKDVDGHIFEVGVSRSSPGIELFEGVPNPAYNMFRLLHGQFSRYRFHDALGQLRNFGLHVEPCIHHFTSFRCAGHYHAVRGFASADAFKSPSSE
jgi:hypothetical protein